MTTKYNIVQYIDFPMETDGESVSFKSSFGAFDEKIGGIALGEVVVITGETKNGKTLFAESWLRSMMKKDPRAKTCIFSFEVQTKKLLRKYLVEDDIYPLYVPLELKTMDFEWLKQNCQEARDRFNCRLILVDHLHFLVDMNTNQNMSLNIGAFMRRLKQEIAIGLEMGVILIAHQGQLKENQVASIRNIRDSSFVAQESDSVITVARRANYTPVELKDYEIKYGEAKADLLRGYIQGGDPDDKHSGNLAIVKIEVARRSGALGFAKLFRKEGEYLVEL